VSFGAFKLASSLTVEAAAGSPVLVQQVQTYNGTGSATLPLKQPAAAGNTLVMCITARDNQTPATPSGWTKAGDLLLPGTSVGHVWWFTKLAAGGETSVSFTWAGVSTINGIAAQEWQGTVTLSGFSGAALGAASPATFGPSTAPPNANAVPLLYAEATTLTSNESFTADAAWNYVGPSSASGTKYGVTIIGTQAAPNAAVSVTFTYSAGVENTYATIAWVSK
jgi:hypothetical protein